MATATAKSTTEKVENPRKTPDQVQPPSDPLSTLQQPLPSTPEIDSHREDGDESKPSVTGAVEAVKETDVDKKDEPVTSVQKKIRRAERFGMPVQLSEEEKRNSRAERFGTASAVHGSDTMKQSEEHKRKARAERFGLAQSLPADEEAKKKARLSRFGAVPGVPKPDAAVSKPDAAVSKPDALEEDKKKARALRFSQPPSGSLAQLNGKGSGIEMKTATAGKAGGGT